MAVSDLSPRQRMINLMYLVFIAMLALNLSKEVLSAFGSMYEKLTESNISATQRNQNLLTSLAVKADEAPEKFSPLKQQADQISQLAGNFDTYISDLKSKMLASVEDPTDYEVMDKGDYLDSHFFRGDKLEPEGLEFIDQINAFRAGVTSILSSNPGYEPIINDINKKFSTDPVINRDGKTLDWLDYNYKGFPLVASVTKLTQIQADVKNTTSEVLNSMLAGSLKAEASMTNYTTLLETSKSAYFNGEAFDGQIVLGRKDPSTKPNKVELTLDGRPLTEDQYSIENGKVRLNINAGNPGEHLIEGKLVFIQDGEELEVPVKSTFATVPKPNSATISADKMNVVYRGVSNPMTISFAGIPDNKVAASGAGLSKSSGSGKYVMNPGSGREVTINVKGTLPDGSPVSDNATFRIKDIPKPIGTVNGQDGIVNLPRNNIEISRIGAKLDDFDFDLPIQVTSFNFKVPGQPTVSVNGTQLNEQAKNALRKAKRGDNIQIFDIKAQIQGNSSYKLKGVTAVIIELAN